MSDRVNNGRFSVLPDELCLRILHYLPASDVAKCMRVCRRWYALCNDASLWTQVEISCRFVRTIVSGVPPVRFVKESSISGIYIHETCSVSHSPLPTPFIVTQYKNIIAFALHLPIGNELCCANFEVGNIYSPVP